VLYIKNISDLDKKKHMINFFLEKRHEG
jgi:hypothetical protein